MLLGVGFDGMFGHMDVVLRGALASCVDETWIELSDGNGDQFWAPPFLRMRSSGLAYAASEQQSGGYR